MVSKEAGIFLPRERETGINPFVPTRNNEVVVFPQVHLSPPQKEVLILTAQGLSRKQIAEKLFLQIGSIAQHRKAIKDAFLTNSMLHAVVKAVNTDILDVSELTKDLDKQSLEKLSRKELEVLGSFANGRNQQGPGTRNLQSVRRKLELNSLQSTLLYMAVKKEGALPSEEYRALTYQQRRVFKLIISGYSTKQISEMLNATITAIGSHRRQIFKLFDVSTITELLIKLVEMKTIDPYKYIETVKKANNHFLKNVNTADISSLLPAISKGEKVFLNAFVKSSIKGGFNKEIANLLKIPTATVIGRCRSISRKLGGAKREHIAMWYIAATTPIRPDPTNAVEA